MLLYKFTLLYLCVGAFTKALTRHQETDLDTFVSETMQCRDVVGFSLALVKDGQTVYTKGYGLRDYERKLPMTPTTITAIASISKAFTTTLISDSVAKGELSWDAPLREVIPDFALPGDFRTQLCSLRDSVSHRIGIPNYWGVSMACLNVSREELVRRMAHFPPQHDFRLTYRYANYPYVMAARSMEVKTGKTWEQLIREKIFEPLGMTRAKVGTEIHGSDWDEVAWGHTVYQGNISRNPENVQIPFLNEIGPSASIFASAEDMARWMNFHLSGGKNENGTQVFDERALREIYSSSNSLLDPSWRVAKPRFPVDDVDFTYAQAWRTGMYRGRQKIHHLGLYSGYNCRMTLLLEANVGVWACTNSPGNWKGSTAARMVSLYALDLLLGEEPWLNTTTACSFPAPWVPPRGRERRHILQEDTLGGEEDLMKEDDDIGQHEKENGHRLPRSVPGGTFPLYEGGAVHNLHLYIGEYDHPGFGTFRIFEEDGALRCRLGRFLNGEFRREYGMGESRLRMLLRYPYTYRMYTFGWIHGYPTDFANPETEGVVTRFISVRVGFLQLSLPPMFIRKGHTVSPTAVPTPCPTQVVGGQANTSAELFLILMAIMPQMITSM